MGRPRSASRRANFTRRVIRAKIDGRVEGGTAKRSTGSPIPKLLGRLRRLEFAVLYALGERSNFDVDSFKLSVLSLEADAQIQSRGRNLRRGEVQVPHEGGTGRKAARETEDIRRPASGDEDGELSPFPPGEPDEGP